MVLTGLMLLGQRTGSHGRYSARIQRSKWLARPVYVRSTQRSLHSNSRHREKLLYEQDTHLHSSTSVRLTHFCGQQMVSRRPWPHRLEQSPRSVRRQVGLGGLHVRVLPWSRPGPHPLPRTYTRQDCAAERACQFRYAAPLCGDGYRVVAS